jgi:hypothetical protein
MSDGKNTNDAMFASMGAMSMRLTAIFFFASLIMWLFLRDHPITQRNAWVSMFIGYFLALSVAAIGGESSEKERISGIIGTGVFSIILFVWGYFMYVDEARRRNASHGTAVEMTRYTPVPSTDASPVAS